MGCCHEVLKNKLPKTEPHRTKWQCSICNVPLCNNKMRVLKNFIQNKLSIILAIIHFILCNYLSNAFLIK